MVKNSPETTDYRKTQDTDLIGCRKYICQKRSTISTVNPDIIKVRKQDEIMLKSEAKLTPKDETDNYLALAELFSHLQNQSKFIPVFKGKSEEMRNVPKLSPRGKGNVDKNPDSAFTNWILNDFRFDESGKEFGAEKDLNMMEITDINHMLGVVISTVMLLAHGYSSCPTDHLKCTSMFLRNVKDIRGKNPQNIASILNVIEAFLSRT